MLDTEPMKQPRSNHSSISHKGFVYVFGGFVKEEQKCLNSCERFNVGKNKWGNIASMKVERSKPTVFIHKNSIYVIGGMSPSQSYLDNICEKYNE